MTVRAAVESDYEGMAEVQRRAVDRCLRPLYDSAAIDVWLGVIDAAKFARVANTGETLLVASLDDAVVGFSSFHPDMSLVGMWYVDPDSMGQGVGSLLLSHAEEGLGSAGCRVATAEASLFARPHFETRGWKPIEEFDKPAFGTLMRVTRMEKVLAG